MTDLGRRAARGTLWLGLVNVLSKGAQMLVTVALGVFLDAPQLGTVTITVTLVNLAQIVQSMGVFDVVARTRADPEDFAATVATLSVGAGTTLGAALAVFAGPVAGLLGAADSAPLLRVAAVSLPFTAYAGVQLAYLHRELDFRRRLFPDATSAITGAAVTVAAAALGAGAWSLVAGIVTTAVLAPLLGLVVGVRIPLRWNRAFAGETLRWVRLTGPGAVLGVALLQVDYVIVTRTLGPAANGVYSFAYRIAFVPYITVAFVLGAVAFSVYAKVGTTPGVAAAFARFWHALVAVTAGLYLVLALLADRIVVVDARWAPSVPVLRVLSLYGLLFGLVLACHEAIRGIGRPDVYLRVQAAHLVLLTAAAVALVGPFGVVGVAWAQVAAVSLVLAGQLAVLARAGVLTAGVPRGLLGPAVAASVTAGLYLAAQAAGLLPPAASLPWALVLGPAVAVVYAGLLLGVDRRAVADLRAARGGGSAPEATSDPNSSVDADLPR